MTGAAKIQHETDLYRSQVGTPYEARIVSNMANAIDIAKSLPHAHFHELSPHLSEQLGHEHQPDGVSFDCRQMRSTALCQHHYCQNDKKKRV